MSLGNQNPLLASMFNRATSVSFDPIQQMNAPQFNPTTGSWVFGLAAFAAGVAINKIIKSDSPQGPDNATGARTHGNPSTPRSSQNSKGRQRQSAMNALLHDTMEEESRSGGFLDQINSEVAKLREEVAALSSQKAVLKNEIEASASNAPFEEQSKELSSALSALNKEKQLAPQPENEELSPHFSEAFNTVRSDLKSLQEEQVRLRSEYESTQIEAREAHKAIVYLQQQLAEKEAKLHEAEQQQEILKRDRQMLLESVESLNSQLEFFRSQNAEQGGASLEILEASNQRLIDQVKSSRMEAESLRSELLNLAAEKLDLIRQLESYAATAEQSELRMQKLEEVLNLGKKAEMKLLTEVEQLTNGKQVSNAAQFERSQLELELANSQSRIESLEGNIQQLIGQIEAGQSSNDQTALTSSRIEALKSQRDNLQAHLEHSKALLKDKDDNYNNLEKTYREFLQNSHRLSTAAKTDLVEAAEKEEELGGKIHSLVKQIGQLQNERDLYKSQAEGRQLTALNNGNEFQALKQSILTLESEKNALSSELDTFQKKANLAEERQAQAEAKIQESHDQEKVYREQLLAIKSDLKGNTESQQELELAKKYLQQANLEIQSLVAARQKKDHELAEANHELAELNQKLLSLSQQSKQFDQDERLAGNQVQAIQTELRQRDNYIANARITEDGLRREIEMLEKTAGNMQAEVMRLGSIQSEVGANASSVNVLRETEALLNKQIQEANAKIQEQHLQLMRSERAKAELELAHREESIRFNALQMENSDLQNSLTQWEEQEKSQQLRVGSLRDEAQSLLKLEQENTQIRQENEILVAKLTELQHEESTLRNSFSEVNGKLEMVIAERDRLLSQLDDISHQLAAVTAERNELQQTSGKLAFTIQDLERRLQQKDEELAKSQQEQQRQYSSRIDNVIPLTHKDAIIEEEALAHTNNQENTAIPTSRRGAFEAPSADKLFQSEKISKLRKFKGHNKTIDIDAKEELLDQQAAEEIAESKTSDSEEQPVKKKVHSPNRTFLDLLDDNARLKKEQTKVDLEDGWDDLDFEEEEEDKIVLEEGSSSKKLWLYGSAACVAIAAGGYAGYAGWASYNLEADKSNNRNQVENTGDSNRKNTANNNKFTPDHTPKLAPDNDTTAAQHSQALKVLTDFLDSDDPQEKANLCRLPNRTLRDIKQYSIEGKLDFKVTKVTNTEEADYGDLKLIKATVLTELDGEIKEKIVFFSKSTDGKLLLDWHTFVKFETTTWENFGNLDNMTKPVIWNVSAQLEQLEENDHPDFTIDKFTSLRVRSWDPDSSRKTAYISKTNPRYKSLMDAYNQSNGEAQNIILKLHHHGDGTYALVVDEIISLNQFYEKDIESSVSLGSKDISFDESSY